MKCECGGQLFVVETRPVRNTVKRRRECKRCGERWTTYEVSAEAAKLIKTFCLQTAVTIDV